MFSDPSPALCSVSDERSGALYAFAEEIGHARAQLKHQHELASPVHRMPTDVMAKIFERCIRDHPNPRADPLTAPLLLTQVCRSWRHLLLSLPCMWTTLQVDLPPSAMDWGALLQSKSLLMHVWFSRSKALPISLFINHKESFISWLALVQFEKDLLTLCSRLKQLALHFSSQYLNSLLTFTQCPLPYLERLELQDINVFPMNEDPPLIVMHSAPNLINLTLCWYCLDLGGFRVPWTQLQHLNLGYDANAFCSPVHSDYLQTLACCPNLTALYLGIGHPRGPTNHVDPAHATSVTLPQVHTFKTRVHVQTPYLAHFFDALCMPQLCHFDIKYVGLVLGSYSGQTECLPFLARCADTLESVCFDRVDIPDAAVVWCLAHLHRLRTMSFLPGVLRLNHGFITALTHEGEGERVCPALEVLHLRCTTVVPVDTIAQLVASRRRTVPKLRQFSLQFALFGYGSDTRGDKIEEVQARLKEYVEDGLALVVTTESST